MMSKSSTVFKTMSEKVNNSYCSPLCSATFTLILISSNVLSQINDSLFTEYIAVMARPSPDSITLRWAPVSFSAWSLGNKHGYRIERFLIAKDGVLQKEQQKMILHPAVKAFPEDQWLLLVQRNRYAAVAAQALFGDRFEVDLTESDVFTIVDKVQENEQRFAFALFSADMSPEVAKASGLWWTDRQVKKGEKYLYRIIIDSADSLRGSVFVGPDDPYHLPNPENLQGDFQEQLVSLKWDKNKNAYFTAYKVEQSYDGKDFTLISDTPLVTVSPAEAGDAPFVYAVDSLHNPSQTRYYRVRGITPFGEESPPSQVISGKAQATISDVPYIYSVENIENKSLRVHWLFSEESNKALQGFTVERSARPDGPYTTLTPAVLSPEIRSYEDTEPEQTNYYRLTAHALNGDHYPSHIYFANLVDSIPPLSPGGLEATVSDEVGVTLSWKRNLEADLYGYRIYKAYHKSEEPAQLTSAPVADTLFVDTVDLYTLNETLYYQVMAIDVNQNHSALSRPLRVPLPDHVRPQPPIFLPVRSDADGVVLKWRPGSSQDIVNYKVFRKVAGREEWEQLKELGATSDSVYSYRDDSAKAGETNYYTVIATDDAGLESDPSEPVSGGRINHVVHPSIRWKKPLIIREENVVRLSWNAPSDGVRIFRIFRAVDEHPLVLFKTLSGDQHSFADFLIPGKRYAYRILAVFHDENQSALSEELGFLY
jgi:fibronectin type 3 domain-containing protein